MNRTSRTFRRVTGAAVALSVGLVLVTTGTASAATSVKAKDLADAPLPFSFATNGWALVDIPDGQRPYQASTAASLTDTKPHDANGVRKFVLNGVTYDHPQGQAALGLSMLDGYRVTKNKRYLDIAVANATRLVNTKVVDTTVVADGAWFFPYKFNFALHRYPAFLMRAPWYSGMAQGQALGLFSRLAAVTGDAAWQTAADRTFASFLIAKRSTGPWVSEKDADGHLWIEEYAAPTGTPPSDRTFNGHNFAVSGLYDYFELTQDVRARQLADGAMTAALAHLPQLRTPAWLSHYCLAHPEVTSAGYHAIHIGQMLWFHQFTGDYRFARWADTLMADYPTAPLVGSVRFLRGAHVGYQFTASGGLVRSKTISLSRASSAPMSERKRVYHRGGYYYLITAGMLKGYYVREASTQYFQGTKVLLSYRTARTVLFPANAKVGVVSVTSAGQVFHAGTLTYATATPFTIDARGVVNGVDRVRISSGKWKGWWVAAAQVTYDPAT